MTSVTTVSRSVRAAAYAVPLCVLPSAAWRVGHVVDVTLADGPCGGGAGESLYVVSLSVVSMAAACLTVTHHYTVGAREIRSAPPVRTAAVAATGGYRPNGRWAAPADRVILPGMLLDERHGRASAAARPPQWVRWTTWTAIVAPLPYSLSRLVWVPGIPLGIDADLLRDFQSPGVGSLYILCLALLPEITALFTHTFLVTRRRTVPARVPLAGGRRVRPSLVVAALLVPIAILAGFNVWSLGPIMDGFSIPAANDGVAAWSFWGQVASFWVWGVSLAIATAAYGWATRGDD